MFAKLSLVLLPTSVSAGASSYSAGSGVWAEADYTEYATKVCGDVNSVKMADTQVTTASTGIKAKCDADASGTAYAACDTDAKIREYLCSNQKSDGIWGQLCTWSNGTCAIKSGTKLSNMTAWNAALCVTNAATGVTRGTKPDCENVAAKPAANSNADANLQKLFGAKGTGWAAVDPAVVKFKTSGQCAPQPVTYFPAAGTKSLDAANFTGSHDSVCKKKAIPFEACRWSGSACAANINTSWAGTACTLPTFDAASPSEDPCTTTTAAPSSSTAAPKKKSSSGVRSFSVLFAGLSMVAAIMA